MVQEIRTRSNQNFNTLKEAYNNYDNVLVVSEDLIEPTPAADRAFRGACSIANCYNQGPVSGGVAGPVGGIAGIGSVEVYGCYSTGQVTGEGTHVAALVGVLLLNGYAGASSDGVVTFTCTGRVHEAYALGSVAENLFYYVDAACASIDAAQAVELTSDGTTWNFDAGFLTETYMTGSMAWT